VVSRHEIVVVPAAGSCVEFQVPERTFEAFLFVELPVPEHVFEACLLFAWEFQTLVDTAA
jgi:hypothetical protein